MTRLPKVLLGTTALTVAAGAASAQEELNALVWCDHTDPALIEPFEEAHGVEVNLREYEGTGAALALLEQSRPGDWDVLVIDGIDVFRAVEAGILAPLPEDELPTADFFPEVVMAENNTLDGVTYAVTEKFGYNTISYNSERVDPADMESLATAWSEKYDGRISIYDYYLPVMGLAAIAEGIPPPRSAPTTSNRSAASCPRCARARRRSPASSRRRRRSPPARSTSSWAAASG